MTNRLSIEHYNLNIEEEYKMVEKKLKTVKRFKHHVHFCGWSVE